MSCRYTVIVPFRHADCGVFMAACPIVRCGAVWCGRGEIIFLLDFLYSFLQ